MQRSVKFLDCLFVGIAVSDFYQSLVLFPATFFSVFAPFLPALRFILIPLSLACLLFIVLYPVIWRRQENKAESNSELRHAWFLGIIRYWLAVEIFDYGFAKILGTQFDPNYFRSDSVWHNLSGLDITWNYFSYSYAMSLILAGVQIAGAALLLFRRTSILGVIILLPVMVNIVLIDIFYAIPAGALINAILFTLGLSYLLLLRWSALKEFFIQARQHLPIVRLGGTKNFLRLALALYAFVFIYLVTTTKAPADLSGKWKVDQLVRNGDTAKANDWLTDRLSWKNVYLEDYGRATFSPNPYAVESERATTGFYKYFRPTQTIRFLLHSLSAGTDTVYATVTRSGRDQMKWRMVQHKDTLNLELTKVKETMHH